MSSTLISSLWQQPWLRNKSRNNAAESVGRQRVAVPASFVVTGWGSQLSAPATPRLPSCLEPALNTQHVLSVLKAAFQIELFDCWTSVQHELDSLAPNHQSAHELAADPLPLPARQHCHRADVRVGRAIRNRARKSNQGTPRPRGNNKHCTDQLLAETRTVDSPSAPTDTIKQRGELVQIDLVAFSIND